MSDSRIDEPPSAEVYDNALRWTIASDSNPHETYLVELNAAPGYSVCACKRHECVLGPILARGISPEDAVQQGLVKPKDNQAIDDVLKCKHVIEAEKRFARAAIASLSNARTKNTPQAYRV